MKLKILILSSILLLAACENAPVRRTELLSQHPEWDAQTQKLVRAGYAVKGMNQKQVEAAWGKPCWSCTGTTKGDWGEAWEYPTQVIFFNNDGDVTRLEKK